MYRGLDCVRITVLTFVERTGSVDRDTHDVITFGHAGDVDPLSGELLVIPVTPAGSYTLKAAVVAVALAAIVFERVFKAEPLLVSGDYNRAGRVQQFII